MNNVDYRQRGQFPEIEFALLDGIAQDINSLYMIIQGQTLLIRQFLRRRNTDRSGLEDVECAVERGAQRISDFLAREGVEVPHHTTLDVARLVSETCEAIRGDLPPEFRLTQSCESGHHAVQGNPSGLRHVILNLMRNALESTPRGGRIHVRVFSIPATFVANVEIDGETGEGISISVQRDPGEANQDPDGPERRSRRTSGRKANERSLGLAVASDLVQAQGGVLRVETRPDVGSTFTVCLPRSTILRERRIGVPLHDLHPG